MNIYFIYKFLFGFYVRVVDIWIRGDILWKMFCELKQVYLYIYIQIKYYKYVSIEIK